MLRKLARLRGEGGKALSEFASVMKVGQCVQEATRGLSMAVRLERRIIELGMTDARLRTKFDDPGAEGLQSLKFYEESFSGSGTKLSAVPLPNFDLSAQYRDSEIEQAIHKEIEAICEVRTCFLREVVIELNRNAVLKKNFIKFMEEAGVEKYFIPLQEAGLN